MEQVKKRLLPLLRTFTQPQIRWFGISLPTMDRLLLDGLYNLFDRLFFSSLGRSVLLCSALYYTYVAFKKHRDYRVEWVFNSSIFSYL